MSDSSLSPTSISNLPILKWREHITENTVYQGLEPAQLWRHFAALNSIPRPSGGEAGARDYVRQVADAAGAVSEVDTGGNVIVRVPARGGGAVDAPVVAVQAHLDMVCEKRPNISHNFTTDPILPRREGDHIYATGTTLGADNGIGAAAALALLTEAGLKHGPLELLFTVEEETGLCGAMALDPALLQAAMLVNLDSEDPNELTIGCAGGAGTSLHLPLNRESAPADWVGAEIAVSGLKGGHSGVQIHEPLANAIKLLTEVLLSAKQAGVPLQLVSIAGGSAHNAIPRDAHATVAIPPAASEAFQSAISEAEEKIRAQWKENEPGITISRTPTELPAQVLTLETGNALLELLNALPHGVIAMSQEFAGKVQTSTNLAGLQTKGEEAEIATSSRSFVEPELQQLQERIQVLGTEAGARIEVRDGYPGWEPNAHSRLLQVATEVFEQLHGKPVQIEVIHAGLECGVIVSKKPELEAISFGPLIQGAHSPEEHVTISTVEPTWRLLTNLLAALS